MPLSPKQETFCERLEKGEPEPTPQRSFANKPAR